MGTATTIYGDYLPVGDISVLALCFLIFILFLGTFVHRNTQYRQLRYSIWCIFAGTVANLVYHQMLKEPAASVSPLTVTVIRDINCFLFQFTMMIYVDYILRLVSVSGKEKRVIRGVALTGFIIFAIMQLAGHFLHFGFYIDSDGGVHNNARISFAIAFVFFSCMIFYCNIKFATNKEIIVIFNCIVKKR